MQTLKSILNRLNNKGTILAIVGLVLNILIQLGFQVESDKITNIVNIVCTLLVSLGILNNPVDNKEAYIPGVSDKLVEKKVKEEIEEAPVEQPAETVSDSMM